MGVVTSPAPRSCSPLTPRYEFPPLVLDPGAGWCSVDAIARATEDDPDFLFETSTLTGAQIVALGTRTMGVMGSERSGTGSPNWPAGR